MAKKAELRSVLTMDLSPFKKSAAAALAIGKSLAKQFARNPVRFLATASFLGAEKAVRGLAGGMGSIVKASARMATTVAKIGIPLLTAGLIAGTVHAYAFGSEMQDMADRTGVSVEKLVVLTQAMKDNGIESEALLSATKKINVTMVDAAKGNATAAASFEQVGLHVKDLLDMDPGERFMAIGKAVGSLGHDATRSAAAVALLGKSGQQFLSLFADPEAMKTAAESVGSQAQIFGKNAALFDRISDRLGRISVKIRGLFAGVAERIAPMMDKLTAIFDKKDFADWGHKIGDAINKAAAWFVTFWNNPSKTMGYFWEEAKGYALDLGNVLVKVAKDFGEALGDGILSKFKSLNVVAALPGAGAGGAIKGFAKDIANAAPKGVGGGAGGPVTDILGAGAQHARAAAIRPSLDRALGLLGQNAAQSDAGPDMKTPWRLRGFHGAGQLLGKDSILKFHSSLQGASMGGALARMNMQMSPSRSGISSLSGMHLGAYGGSPLLSHGEMERYRSIAASRGVPSIDGMATRRPGEVHAGDRARRKAFEKNEERKRVKGLTEVEALNVIADESKKTAKATIAMAKEIAP